MKKEKKTKKYLYNFIFEVSVTGKKVTGFFSILNSLKFNKKSFMFYQLGTSVK